MVELNREFIIKLYGKKKLPGLKVIKVSLAKIDRINPNTFVGLVKLESLSLSYNEIKTIDSNSFVTLSNLRILYLQNGKLERIDSNLFKGLVSLEQLYLEYNSIKEIETNAFQSLSNLKELNISYNKLKRIESATFKGLFKLESLLLNDNEITEIDKSSFESLENLKEMSLKNNKLKSVNSSSFKGLRNLKVLLISNNELVEIESDFFQSFSKLEKLSLLGNKLNRIGSNSLSGLVKLEQLSLQNNMIEEIDSNSFESLSSLRILNLSDNKLREMYRECFSVLKSIEVIQLYNTFLIALSFYLPITSTTNSNSSYYNKACLEKCGYHSDWNSFLMQFRQIEKLIPPLSPIIVDSATPKKNSSLPATSKIEHNDKERRQTVSFFKFIEKEEKKRSQSSSNESSINEKKIEDAYIGKIFNDRYQAKKKLGQGGFGSVYLVYDNNMEGNKMKQKAMKIMNASDSAAENELELLWDISHDNIVRYFDHFKAKISDCNHIFLITEFCQNGDLKTRIDEKKRLKLNFRENEIFKWMLQATKALLYLHCKEPPIIHRDIKPANMLLTGKDDMKIGDLGVSKVMQSTHANTHTGTIPYMSPEVFRSQMEYVKYYPNTDIWSLGCVLYELIFLELAFPKGQRGNPELPSKLLFSARFSSIISKMFQKDCLNRIQSKHLLTELELFQSQFL